MSTRERLSQPQRAEKHVGIILRALRHLSKLDLDQRSINSVIAAIHTATQTTQTEMERTKSLIDYKLPEYDDPDTPPAGSNG